MTPKKALEAAVAHMGSMQALASQLGITKGAVSQWKHEGRRIPTDHCPQIERLTGGAVRCEDLRPDIFAAAPPDSPTAPPPAPCDRPRPGPS